MKFLLDTMVVSESIKPRRSMAVDRWLAATLEADIGISTISVGEISYGASRLAPGARRARLETWLANDVIRKFAGGIVAVDLAVAEAWAKLPLVSTRTRPTADMLIAATAAAHNLTLVTRNVKDFAGLPISLFDPY